MLDLTYTSQIRSAVVIPESGAKLFGSVLTVAGPCFKVLNLRKPIKTYLFYAILTVQPAFPDASLKTNIRSMQRGLQAFLKNAAQKI